MTPESRPALKPVFCSIAPKHPCTAFADLLTPDHKVVALLHEDEVSSQGNHFEARVVAGAVWMLRQSISVALDGRGTVTHADPTPSEFWNLCVGIVTPHRAQRALVIRELEQLFPGEKNFIDDAVDTVERFQDGCACFCDWNITWIALPNRAGPCQDHPLARAYHRGSPSTRARSEGLAGTTNWMSRTGCMAQRTAASRGSCPWEDARRDGSGTDT